MLDGRMVERVDEVHKGEGRTAPGSVTGGLCSGHP